VLGTLQELERGSGVYSGVCKIELAVTASTAGLDQGGSQSSSNLPASKRTNRCMIAVAALLAEEQTSSPPKPGKQEQNRIEHPVLHLRPMPNQVTNFGLILFT